jgi:hypothetical protein
MAQLEQRHMFNIYTNNFPANYAINTIQFHERVRKWVFRLFLMQNSRHLSLPAFSAEIRTLRVLHRMPALAAWSPPLAKRSKRPGVLSRS